MKTENIVLLGVGVAVAGVAGYLVYKKYFAKIQPYTSSYVAPVVSSPSINTENLYVAPDLFKSIGEKFRTPSGIVDNSFINQILGKSKELFLPGTDQTGYDNTTRNSQYLTGLR